MSEKLTPMEDLFMEVLSARIRLGEPWWTFESSAANRKVSRSLVEMGLITRMSGLVERTFRANLTDKGKTEWLDESYVSPLARDHRATKEMLAKANEFNSDLVRMNANLEVELRENEGVIRALRRQRDDAEKAVQDSNVPSSSSRGMGGDLR